MLWDPFLYCINDSIQGNSETGNKVFVLPSKVAINTYKEKPAVRLASKMEIEELLRIRKEDKEDTQNEST